MCVLDAHNTALHLRNRVSVTQSSVADTNTISIVQCIHVHFRSILSISMQNQQVEPEWVWSPHRPRPCPCQPHHPAPPDTAPAPADPTTPRLTSSGRCRNLPLLLRPPLPSAFNGSGSSPADSGASASRSCRVNTPRTPASCSGCTPRSCHSTQHTQCEKVFQYRHSRTHTHSKQRMPAACSRCTPRSCHNTAHSTTGHVSMGAVSHTQHTSRWHLPQLPHTTRPS